jgi:LemA protein
MYLVLVIIAVICLLALIAVATYKGLIGKRNRYKHAYAQIDVQLKRRYDLIPNLIETVRAYLKHETETLEKLLRARNSAYGASQRAAENAGDPLAMLALTDAEAALSTGLSRLLALSEAHPDLVADESMRELSGELTNAENRVELARQTYNDYVTQYNNTRETLPAVLFAGVLGFGSAGPLDADDRRLP